MPSEYFAENVYLTFQDDWVAFKVRNLGNINRLLWANDFPHSDSTWPNSQALLEKHTQGLNAQEKDWLLHDNVAQLYGIVSTQMPLTAPGSLSKTDDAIQALPEKLDEAGRLLDEGRKAMPACDQKILVLRGRYDL